MQSLANRPNIASWRNGIQGSEHTIKDAYIVPLIKQNKKNKQNKQQQQKKPKKK